MAKLEVLQVPAWAEANKPRIVKVIRLFDETLERQPFWAGDAFSAAGITATVRIS
jgi:glutathione S-transferase